MSAALGLRGRLVAALMTMAVVALGIAALIVLSPLERRLRDQEISALTGTALTARESFADLDVSDLRANGPALGQLVHDLARRTDAQAAVVDSNGRQLVNTDPELGERFPLAMKALRNRRVLHILAGSGDDREVRLAVPVDVVGHRFAVSLRKSLSAVTGAVSVVRHAFIVAAVITVLLALALGMLIATRLVRRLRALRTTAMRVAELGPGVELHDDEAHDEVADLTRSFQVMQTRLRAQEEARRSFVASASHELRTPLQSLVFMLDMLHEDLAGETPDLAHAREEAGRARAQAERLSTLSSELLDLSRIDARVALRREPIELTGLCRSVIAEFAARAADARQSVELADGPPAWVLADPGALAQILRALLDNALRFSPTDGQVKVEPSRDKTIVVDEGPGVAPHERDVIFERFRRGREGRGGAGFGLGLAIGRELARRMDGDLQLEGEGPGARFVLTLPPAPAGPANELDRAPDTARR